jgi:hypothetical protein
MPANCCPISITFLKTLLAPDFFPNIATSLRPYGNAFASARKPSIQSANEMPKWAAY